MKKFVEGKYFFVEEKKSREGIGGKYFEKENIWLVEEKRKRRKICGQGRRKRTEKERRKIF